MVDPERNRELLAVRLGWPPGALDECRKLEADWPSYSVSWDAGEVPPRGPGYRASLRTRYWASSVGPPAIYAPTPGELSALLAADVAARAAERQRHRPNPNEFKSGL